MTRPDSPEEIKTSPHSADSWQKQVNELFYIRACSRSLSVTVNYVKRVCLDRKMSFYEAENVFVGGEPDDASDIAKNLLDELSDGAGKSDGDCMLPPPPSQTSAVLTSNPMQVYLRIRPLKASEKSEGEDQVRRLYCC